MRVDYRLRTGDWRISAAKRLFPCETGTNHTDTQRSPQVIQSMILPHFPQRSPGFCFADTASHDPTLDARRSSLQLVSAPLFHLLRQDGHRVVSALHSSRPCLKEQLERTEMDGRWAVFERVDFVFEIINPSRRRSRSSTAAAAAMYSLDHETSPLFSWSGWVG